jgi:hypothetical protein
MKRILILISITFLVASCNNDNLGPKAPNSKRMELDPESKYSDQNYKVYTLEGCEYILVGAGNGQWGSHKGNCKNPIHKIK